MCILKSTLVVTNNQWRWTVNGTQWNVGWKRAYCHLANIEMWTASSKDTVPIPKLGFFMGWCPPPNLTYKWRILQISTSPPPKTIPIAWNCAICAVAWPEATPQNYPFLVVQWVHRKCSGINGSMYKAMKTFICRGCMNPVTGTGCTSVDIGRVQNRRVRVRVSSNFLPLTSTKTVELFNEMLICISFAYHY